MKHLMILRTLVLSLILIPGFSIGKAQPASGVEFVGSGGWGFEAPYNLLWDPSFMVSFSGRITGIQVSPPLSAMDEGVSLLVLADNGGTALVHLGPIWFINNQPVTLQIGDRVSVRGSKVFIDNRSAIMAQTLTRNSMAMFLRDEAGVPYWAGWRPAAAAERVPLAGNVEILQGRVLEIQGSPQGAAGFPNMILVIDPTAPAAFPPPSRIPLGPGWFFVRQDGFPIVGQNVTIRGQIQQGQFVPWSVQSGNQVFLLRADGGRPIWNSWAQAR